MGRSPSPHPPAETKPGSRWLHWWRGKRPVLRFGLSFALLMAAYYALAATPWFDRVIHRLLHWNALASGGVLNLLGQDTRTADTIIRSARFSVNIRRGCDAVEPVWYFTAAIVSFPAPPGRKLAGIAAGAALLCAANVLRIVTLFLIGEFFPRAFGVAHLEVWPALLILLACSLWIAWLVGTRRPPAHASA
jgi:exosortase/archaeosortase family protein